MLRKYFSANAKRGAAKGPVQIVPRVEHDGLKVLTLDAPVLADPRFRVEEGVKWNDFLPFTYSSQFALSEKVKTVFEENAVTGASLHPIDIEGAEQSYYLFVMSHVAPRWTNEAAITEYETDIHEMDLSRVRDLDIFTVEGSILELFSERLVGLLKKAKVKGFDPSPFLVEDGTAG